MVKNNVYLDDGFNVILDSNHIELKPIGFYSKHCNSFFVSIENAEKLASDLLNAVFEATEKVEIDYAAYDEKKWQSIKNTALKIEKIPLVIEMVKSLKVADCEHFQNLYLFCDNKKYSWELKSNTDISDYVMHLLMDCGNHPDSNYSIVSVSIEHWYGKVSL